MFLQLYPTGRKILVTGDCRHTSVSKPITESPLYAINQHIRYSEVGAAPTSPQGKRCMGLFYYVQQFYILLAPVIHLYFR